MEKPIVVYSSWLNNNYEGVLHQKDYAHLSNHLAQKAGYETVLYTDQKSKEFLKDVQFNKVIDFDENILSQFPKTVWASGKLLAFSMQTQPFIHLDFDFFILKNHFLNDIQNKDFVIYHEEPWVKEFSLGKNFYEQGVKKMIEVTNNIFDVDLNYTSTSLNFSIFGTCKKDNVEFISAKAKDMISYLIKMKEVLENEHLIKHFEQGFGALSNAIMSILIEQVIFPSLLIQKLKYNYYPILNSIETAVDVYQKGKDIGLLHLWGMKHNEQLQKLLRNKKFNKNVT